MKYESLDDLTAAIQSANAVKIDVTILSEDQCKARKAESPCEGDRSIDEIAKKIYRARRKRDVIFEDYSIFGEPAWDILLDLFVNNSVGRSVSVKSASLGSAAPDTTALRWLRVLERSGLIHFTQDQSDGRRKLISLTQEGDQQMRRYLLAVAS
ncbi:MarR family transcriptional regulator [Erythrobacter sp.]|uniref:MarR family transcriptional regulator n=1 Tax=Erythrobacter sp. TaxID=1042 RepID=UPI001425D595|nr:MarR family transcriptional regulator [Erythrobacter sp.]QIQ87806.1 MAG: MarR family transcriptional regulator [Erythrobacter sp.]